MYAVIPLRTNVSVVMMSSYVL